MFDSFKTVVQAALGIDPAYAGPMLSALVIVSLWCLYLGVTHALKRYVRSRAFNADNVSNFLLIWRYTWLGVIVVFALISFSGSLAALGMSAAFVGMVMGWSLQAPVTGLAAWLMIILKRPFRIGDRVIIAGITGDVLDINLTHVVLNQVGGTVWGEERSGRTVLIPNATLFNQIIFNYTLESRFILDEVPLAITFASDYDKAADILIEAARDATPEIIAQTQQQPFVRSEMNDNGIRLRLRYQTLAMDRMRINTEIIRLVHRRVRACEDVEFCYPHTQIVYQPAGTGIEAGREQGNGNGHGHAEAGRRASLT